jgi:hypothetical protein
LHGVLTSTEAVAKELFLRSREVEFHGPTMEPFLRDGDRLVVRSAGAGAVRRGDIVVLRFADTFPACRVARTARDGYVLTLDAWPDFNVRVAIEDIVGKVVRRTRGGTPLSCEHWTWRLHAVRALVRERIWSLLPLVRRKRQQFSLGPAAGVISMARSPMGRSGLPSSTGC